jgi:predicted Rossmann fold nucleotide-binding protein DprA/Smf involved in DNA uptake
MLLATGQAKMVRSSADILEEYFDVQSIGPGFTPVIQTPKEYRNQSEKTIIDTLEYQPAGIDTLLEKT